LGAGGDGARFTYQPILLKRISADAFFLVVCNAAGADQGSSCRGRRPSPDRGRCGGGRGFDVLPDVWAGVPTVATGRWSYAFLRDRRAHDEPVAGRAGNANGCIGRGAASVAACEIEGPRLGIIFPLLILRRAPSMARVD